MSWVFFFMCSLIYNSFKKIEDKDGGKVNESWNSMMYLETDEKLFWAGL